MEPPEGGPLLEALLKKAGSGLFGHGAVGKACGEDFAERLARLQRDEHLVLLAPEALVVHGEVLPVNCQPYWFGRRRHDTAYRMRLSFGRSVIAGDVAASGVPTQHDHGLVARI